MLVKHGDTNQYYHLPTVYQSKRSTQLKQLLDFSKALFMSVAPL